MANDAADSGQEQAPATPHGAGRSAHRQPQDSPDLVFRVTTAGSAQDRWHHTNALRAGLTSLRAGWHGLHVDQTGGRGIMPVTFEAPKGQRYRWCFGGIQILRMHWRSLAYGSPHGASPPGV